jgi:outer membrane protein TolC
MSRSFFVFGGKLIALLLLAGCISLVWAQRTDYSKGAKPFPNPISIYEPRKVAPPSFANSTRIDQLIKDGKLMLSLNDAITLALENNLDLAIARYNLDIADTDILRTKGGAAARGVATGLVTGTPGGGVGGFGSGASGASAGGTSSAAGGAGTGSGGLVTSTTGVGPTVPSFDPYLTSTLEIEHAITPQSNIVIAGVPSLAQNTGTANFTYNQGFATGTSMSVGFNNSRVTTNSIRTFLNPALSSSFRLTVSQHLLQGFGIAPNLRFIRITKNSREIVDVAFRGQIIFTVSQIQNIYWDLVNAYEDVRVKERSLGLANQLLADTQKQVQIGTLAPIEVVRSNSAVASAKQDLIVSQTALQLQQLLTKNALARNLQDQALAAAEVIPTDTMVMPATEPVTPIQDLENLALSHRWELAQSRIDLTNRDINKKSARSALLPSLDLFGFYGASGLGGVQNPLATVAPGTVVTTGGYGTTFGNLFDSSAPDKGVGVSLNIPIRNRTAQADQVRSELEYTQAQMRLQQLQNQIRIEVRNAQYALQQNRARVEAASAGAKLAAESLDAEQKKYLLGASTNYAVLQAQRDLAQSESNLVAARATYEKSRVELDRATGQTLTHLGIDVAEAETAQIKKTPNVPGVVPRSQNPQAPPLTPPPPYTQPQTLPPSPSGPVGQPPAQPTPPPTQTPPELQ